MDFGKLTKQAKKFVDERGGTEALGAEAKNLQGILKSKGSLSDKAKQAAAAAKDFGKTPAPDAPAPAAEATPTTPAGAEPKPAEAKPAEAKPTTPPAFDE